MIRAARESDLPAVRNLLVETWHATYDSIYGVDRVTAITNEWHSPPALKSRLELPNAVFLVAAQEDGRIAGMAYAECDAERAKLHQLYVSPAFQGKRLGSQLLLAVEKTLGERQSLSLEVEEANIAARRFYERHGFAQAGTTGNCGAENSGIPALIYVKPAP